MGALVFSGNTLFAADKATNSQQQIPILTVNINQATAEEISDVLTGVGIKKAMVIVAHRDREGAFKSVDDLLQVKGIGPATLEKNRHKLKL
ncbi:MAG: ComEA family DNA-binding protein [Gammaproteobacteria bacterium]|nr:ComEA family DNA-binding protein [Gammaproteobacteria bacterium]